MNLPECPRCKSMKRVKFRQILKNLVAEAWCTRHPKFKATIKVGCKDCDKEGIKPALGTFLITPDGNTMYIYCFKHVLDDVDGFERLQEFKEKYMK